MRTGDQRSVGRNESPAPGDGRPVSARYAYSSPSSRNSDPKSGIHPRVQGLPSEPGPGTGVSHRGEGAGMDSNQSGTGLALTLKPPRHHRRPAGPLAIPSTAGVWGSPPDFPSLKVAAKNYCEIRTRYCAGKTSSRTLSSGPYTPTSQATLWGSGEDQARSFAANFLGSGFGVLDVLAAARGTRSGRDREDDGGGRLGCLPIFSIYSSRWHRRLRD